MALLTQTANVTAGSAAPRLFAVSDIHTDKDENMTWLEGISTGKYQADTVIVAGDISHNLEVIEKTLLALAARFNEVFYTPGNHDLWCSGDGCLDSIHKLQQLLALCARIGVHTGPTRVEPREGGVAYWVVPVLSWHHSSFDTERDLDLEVLPSPPVPISRAVMDFRACEWPKGLDPTGDEVAVYMDELNDTVRASVGSEEVSGERLWELIAQSQEPVISFSHFLPRLELCPEKRFLMYSLLPKVVGSDPLRRRVEALQPSVHVFGHTHFGWDQELDGIRYIQAAVGYPFEREQRLRSLAVGGSPEKLLQSLHVLKQIMHPVMAFLQAIGLADVFDSGNGGHFCPQMSATWSDYYKKNPRDPENMELAWWVKKRH
eukprot:gene22946-27750_t